MWLKNPKVYSPPGELKKKKFPKIIIILFFLLIIFGGLIYFLLYSPFFQIKNIVIEDSTSPEINEILQSLKGKNIILFSSSKIQNEISQKYPEVTDLMIIRGLPDTLKIQFKDRQAKIIWQTQDKNYLVDSRGMIYKEAQEIGDLPKVKDNNNITVNLGQQIVSENFLNFIIGLSSPFNQTTGVKIIRFEINETIFQVDAITDQGWKVIFDTTRKASDQLTDLTKFLAEHKNEVTEYIDLRVEGRVYYQ